MLPRATVRALICVCALACAIASATVSAQLPRTSFKLVKVDVVGHKRYAPTEVAKVSGLTIGQTITPADLDAIAQRMAETGLFTSVRFQYITSGADLTLTFSIEEVSWTMPVVFDNFVWFTDGDLSGAIKQAIPSFDGTSPPNAEVTTLFARELQKLLESRRLPGRVEFTPFVNTRTGEKQHIYAVKDAGPVLKVCALRIEGASAVPEAELREASALVGTDYSRVYVSGVATGTLRQIYRRRGYWKAEFAPPVAAIDAAGCGGTTLALRVSEGGAYLWDGAVWAGQTAVAAKDLDGLVGLKPGEVADVSKIEAGLRAIHGAYETQGYLAQSASFAPKLDDASKRATFEFVIREGPQYRMGTLEIVGLPARDEASLKKKWRLQTGDVYDGSYLTKFVRDEVTPLMSGGGPRRTVSPQTRIDAPTRTVDVRIVVGSSSGG